MKFVGMPVVLLTLIGTVSARADDGQTAAHALSESQIAAIKAIQTQAEQKAAPAALRLAAVVRGPYENNLSDAPDDAVRSALDAENEGAGVADARGEGGCDMGGVPRLDPRTKATCSRRDCEAAGTRQFAGSDGCQRELFKADEK